MWLKLNWSDELTRRLTLEYMSTKFPEADGDVTLGLKHGDDRLPVIYRDG